MGKPFKKELNGIPDTIQWAASANTSLIQGAFAEDGDLPWYIVGSGGSLSACYLVESLLLAQGKFAKAVTPLDLQHVRKTIRNSNILFISASGKNRDILLAFQTAVEEEPYQILAVSMYAGSPLAESCKKFSICRAVEFDIPSGKDGFLASNSLIAYFVIFLKVFGHEVIPEESNFHELDDFVALLKGGETLTVLSSSWGKSVAIDIESKCTEAALFPVLVSDYRNFAHGRHHWFAKKPSSAIVAIVTGSDESLAVKTLKEIPSRVPRLVIRSESNAPSAIVGLLIKAFDLIDKLGDLQKIDPGRPGVPEFGRRLYNLPYASLLKEEARVGNSPRSKLAIGRKLAAASLVKLSEEEKQLWVRSYDHFVSKINNSKFGAVVLDYDGTICSTENRFLGIDTEITNSLEKILAAGFFVAIVTGRGRSVRVDLRKAIAESYWKKVIIGYYNGGVVGTLDNETVPDANLPLPDAIRSVEQLLQPMIAANGLKLTPRRWQLTIEIQDKDHWKKARMQIIQAVMKERKNDVRIVESSHSMDVIPITTSKMNILPILEGELAKSGLNSNCLFIGDKGQWPGNDFELLSGENSLSVAEVSADYDSCWNLADLGIRGPIATLTYLERITFQANYMKIKIVK